MEDLKKIMAASTFQVQEGLYVYAKAKEVPSSRDHFMVTKDADEITVVTREENLKNLDLIEKNKDTWSLVALNVSIPFYSVGFLAAVSDAIANEGMNILIVSTYSKDYIMVKSDLIERASNVLKGLGFRMT